MSGFYFHSDKADGLENFAHRALFEASVARRDGRHAFENDCLAWSHAAQARRMLLFHEAYCRAVEVELYAAGMYRRGATTS